MTTGNGQRDAGEGSRLDRIENALELLIQQQAASDRRIEQIVQATELNTAAINGLVDIARDILARVDENSSQIRGLQTENRRILDILQQPGRV